MPRVAIVIVTFNSADEIGGCLDALTGLSAIETVAVDNASIDATRDEITRRGVRLIANDRNAGFAAAVNQGVRATTAPLVLLLNPDAHLVCGLDVLADCLELPGMGAAGGMLIDENGKPQVGFMSRNLPSPATLVFEVLGINRLFPRNRINRHYRCLAGSPMSAALVDQPAGAFLMFRRAAWEQVGGFDERFWPIWFEDVDFCTRIKAAGYYTWYTPQAVAKHTGSHSIRNLCLENRERYWYGSLLEYAAKHYRPAAFRTICVAVAASALVRAIVRYPLVGSKAFAVYGGIVSVALGWLCKLRAGKGGSVV